MRNSRPILAVPQLSSSASGRLFTRTPEVRGCTRERSRCSRSLHVEIVSQSCMEVAITHGGNVAWRTPIREWDARA